MNKSILKCLAALPVAAISGCSSIHTEDYKDNLADNDKAFHHIDEAAKEIVTGIGSGAIVDDFFIDTTPFSVPNDRSVDIPQHLPKTISFYSATDTTETDLKRLMFDDYGIRMDFTRLIEEKREANSPTEEVDTKKVGEEEGYDEYDNNGEKKQKPVVKEPDIWVKNSDKDAAALFGTKFEESPESLLKPVDFSGRLVDFIELVANQSGLSWRYDEVDNTFIFYDLDTKLFHIIDNTDEYSATVAISTETESTSSSSDESTTMGATTMQGVEFKESGKHWDDLKLTVNAILTSNGIATFDQKNGYITVTDRKATLAKVEMLIDKLNDANGTLVFLDVSYIKVDLNKESNISTSLSAEDFLAKISGGAGGGYKTTKTISSMPSILSANFSKSGIQALIGAMSSYGTISTQYEMPMTTMNNTPVPYQTVLEQKYVSSVEKTDDEESGDETSTAITEYNKTGLTSLFTPRVFNDKIIIKGRLSISDNIEMEERTELGITLPTNASETHIINTIIPNGVTKIVSVKKAIKRETSASGPLGENSLLMGGDETVATAQSIAFIMVTPYILK